MPSKEEYLRAIQDTIDRYNNPVGESLFNAEECSMCAVTRSVDGDLNGCIPCPLAMKKRAYGCMGMTTGKKAHDIYDYYCISVFRYGDLVIKPLVKALLKRAKVLYKVMDVINKWPEERFTRGGWVEHKWPKDW
jgi:hypothetical protein